MLGLIWSFWWRYKERFVTMIVGVLIVSSGLSLLLGLGESNKGTVMETLQNKWKVSYHILVRPPGTHFTDKENGLFEPNIQGGISGGISTQQLETIKKITDVEVAAPLAVIGYHKIGVKFNEEAHLKNYGIYKVNLDISANNGIQDQTTNTFGSYITYGPWYSGSETYSKYGISYFSDGNMEQFAYENAFLVGIDPVEENKLVGLEQAVIPLPNADSRYFDSSDYSQMERQESSKLIDLPILVSENLFGNKTYAYTYERLNLPFSTAEQAEATMLEVEKNGGINYLKQIKTDESQSYTFHSEQAVKQMMTSLTDTKLQDQEYQQLQRATPLAFESVPSPYPERWPYSYRLQTFEDHIDSSSRLQFPEFYRPYELINDSENPEESIHFFLRPHYVGMYDPSNLKVSKQVGNQFPMDTYAAPIAKFVLDANGRTVNPPVSIKTINNPLGLMTSPPTMLTTMDAASYIMGKEPISVVRIKVSGVDEISQANKLKLEQVAAAIREQTGLLTDITYASSPQPVLIQVPASGSQTKLGWIEQQWIKLGATFTLVNEVKVGFSGMFLLVILVAFIYVIGTNLVSFLVRKKHFAILLALGWRHAQLRKLIILEALLISMFVALVTWSIGGYFVIYGTQKISLMKYLLVGLSSLFIYLMGAVIPISLIQKINPMEAIKSGESSTHVRRVMPIFGMFQLAAAHFFGKIRRNLLSIISMAFPAVLLMFFVFVTIRLQGTFYTSWLGQ